MELKDVQDLAFKLIKSGEKHPDYKLVVDLAEKLKILITGKGMSKLIKQVANRESQAELAQRVALTHAITPAVAASTKKPFYKVARNQRVKITIEMGTETRKPLVEQMIKGFYGSRTRKNRGLDFWLKTRFMELTFNDPNAWVVIEWDKPKTAADVITARPFEVTAAQAINFKIVNDETKWLFVKQDITYLSLAAPGADGQATPVAGLRYTIYEQTYTVVLETIDKAYHASINYVLRAGQSYVDIEDVTYLSEWYEPKIGFVPAVRVGYQRDDSTNGRTFVNPFHDGMCFFDKSIKAVSELDLTMTLHTFPQKLQYVDTCKGPTKEKRCNAGYLSDGTTCPSCKGSGMAIHTSAQDVIYRRMPTNKDEFYDLDKMLVYKHPPIELIKFQNDYVQQLKQEVHVAVFNSQVFTKKTSSGPAGEGSTPVAQTATENDNDMQSAYDALEPFTEKYSEVFKDFATVMALLTGEKAENITIDHTFPPDYKLKSSDILLRELKNANDSGAPSFLKESISNDLAEINFKGDKLGLTRYRVKRRFFPFNGKTEDEIAMLMTSQFVPQRSKILYANYEAIFMELEYDTPGYFLLKIPKQSELLEKKIVEYKEALQLEAPTATTDLFRTAMAGGTGKGDNDPNPGTDNNDSQNSDTENPVD